MEDVTWLRVTTIWDEFTTGVIIVMGKRRHRQDERWLLVGEARLRWSLAWRDAEEALVMRRLWIEVASTRRGLARGVPWRGVGGKAAVRGVRRGRGCAEPGQRLPSRRRRRLEVEVVRPGRRSGRKTGAVTFVAPWCGVDGTARRGSQGRAAIAVPIRVKLGGSTSAPWRRHSYGEVRREARQG